MISSSTGVQQQYHLQIPSTPATHAVQGAGSVNSAASVHTGASTHTDTLEEGKNGFKNAWLRQLEQEKHVQNLGVTNDHARVEKMQETFNAQKVADMLSQERNKKV